MHIYIFGPLYGKSPERLYTSILHRLLPLFDPVRVYRLTIGSGLRVWGLGFRA